MTAGRKQWCRHTILCICALEWGPVLVTVQNQDFCVLCLINAGRQSTQNLDSKNRRKCVPWVCL